MRNGSVVLATRNEYKRREFARLLAPARIVVEALPAEVELPPEDGATFAENALPKARATAAATGRAAFADDSGIEAAALGGRPGIHSARYAGAAASDAENLAKLLAEVPAGSRLRYVCALAFVDPAAGVERVFEGTCEGTLASEPRGEGGFGYDPAFVPVRGDQGGVRGDQGGVRGDQGGVRGDQGGVRGDQGGVRGDRGGDSGGDRGDSGDVSGGDSGGDSGDGSGDGERDGRTMAELSDAEKDAISHRGNAARAFAAWLSAR
jgi:XTP/dITP diphosphohydrolase